ncbi:MAG TPA: NUDIX domain-containing protein [Rhabdochlamydiaceae bacterium]|nr:NUDIX domain-containing protein [Rhabdochlamydiaceae bacterium]
MHIHKEESFGIVPLKEEQGIWMVFLILHKQGRHWGFPKGKRQGDEDAKTSAIRELKEETNLDIVRFLQETPFIESYLFRSKGKKILKTVHYFPAVVSGDLKLQEEEIRDGKWLPLKEAHQQLTFKEARSICDHIIHMLK